MSQVRPTSVNDAAQQLGVNETIIRQMIDAGQIAVDTHEPTLLVLVQDDRAAKPRYTPVPPPMKQTIEAASVTISGTVPEDVAARVLQAMADIGFVMKPGARETHITLTALLRVNTVPEIRSCIETAAGKDKVRAFIIKWTPLSRPKTPIS